VEAGEQVQVGVNKFEDDSTPPAIAAPDYSALASAQRERLQTARRRRSADRARKALEAVGVGAKADTNLMPVIIDAVRARCTVGEISDVLRGVWGVYQPG